MIPSICSVFRFVLIKQNIVFLALLLSSLLFVPFSPTMPMDGLDPSWKYMLNEAVERGLVFGKDVIFTYGPLASIQTRVYSPGTDLLMLFFSGFYIVGLLIAIYLSMPRERQWWSLALPILFCLEQIATFFLLFPFFLLLAVTRMILPHENRYHLPVTFINVLALAFSTYVMAILPLVKGSFSGVVVLVGGMIFLRLCFYKKRAAAGFAILLILSLCVNWVISGQNLLDLPQFFIAQRPIISAYTNAMSIAGSLTVVFVILLAAMLSCVIFFYALRRAFNAHVWLSVLGLIFTLFVAFKAGFVRQGGHIYLTIFALLWSAFAISLYANRREVMASWLIVITVWCLYNPAPVSNIPAHVWSLVYGRFYQTFSGITQRITHPEVLEKSYDDAKQRIRQKHPLPAVTGSVDIYPVELSTVFAHDLQWAGRPIGQSYSVYAPSLDAANANHLRSSQAPETVFFRFGAIDNRLAAIEDASSLLALLAHYTITDFKPPYAVLSRHGKEAAARLVLENMRATRSQFGQAITLNSDRPLWMQVDIKPTLLGRLGTAAFRLPALHIELTMDNGNVVTKRVIAGITSSGFIVTPYLNKVEDFIFLAAGKNWEGEVKSVRFLTPHSGLLWQDDFDVTITPIDITPQQQARNLLFKGAEDNPLLSTVGTSQKSAQCVVDWIWTEGEKRRGEDVTHLSSPSGLIRLSGWTAPSRADDTHPIQAWIVIQTEDEKEHFFKANIANRSDVATHFKRPDLENSGYELAVDLSQFPGKKRLSIRSVSNDEVYFCPKEIIIDDAVTD